MATMEKPIDSSHGDSATSSNQVPLLQISIDTYKHMYAKFNSCRKMSLNCLTCHTLQRSDSDIDIVSLKDSNIEGKNVTSGYEDGKEPNNVASGETAAIDAVEDPVRLRHVFLSRLKRVSNSTYFDWLVPPSYSSSNCFLQSPIPSIFILTMMPFVRAYDAVVAGHKKYLNGLSSISLIVVSYLMIVILVENVIGMPRSMKICSFTLLVLLLGFPLFVAVRAHNEEKERLLSLDFPVTERSTLLDTPKPNTSNAICTINFWLLFMAMICGMGSGLATINNIRQVGESLRYSTVQLNSLVSLWSIWSFLGRFGAGYISDAYLHSHGWPRPAFITLSLVIMALGHIVMASGFLGSLYIGSLLVGLAYGSQWALMPTITSEIFRILHMGTIFYTIGIASPVGSYIFSVKVIGYFYDKVASEDHSCYGSHCFRTSFVIMAVMSVLGSLISFALFLRTKKFYATLVAKRILK
ncbi:unnamed protein product [Brassica oleracea]|nr:unnamed protein product [Brassica napus]